MFYPKENVKLYAKWNPDTYIDTSYTTNMNSMFRDCSSLQDINVTRFDTSNVTDMSHMFDNCSTLTSLDLLSFNTSNVSNMNNMFANSKKLKSIYIGDFWKTDKVATQLNKYDETNGGMFAIKSGSMVLKGNKNTSWSSSHVDQTYAHSDGGTSNPGYLTYKRYAEGLRVSHTSNIDDYGENNGAIYDNNLSTTDIVTIPGATTLTIDLYYSTESDSYDWLAIYPKGVTPSESNYAQATISGGKLAGGRAKSKSGATHKTFTVQGDTAQFFFRSDGSASYYGYFAVITSESYQG